MLLILTIMWFLVEKAKQGLLSKLSNSLAYVCYIIMVHIFTLDFKGKNISQGIKRIKIGEYHDFTLF